MTRKLFIDLMAFNDNVRVAHWQADTLTTAHKALGDLYEAMTGLLDDLVEVVMGKEGNKDMPSMAIQIEPNADLTQLLEFGMIAVRALFDDAEQAEEVDRQDDVKNILADMSAAINKARYLLKV